MPGRPGATAPGRQKAQQQAKKTENMKAAAILHGSIFVVGKLEIEFDGIGAVITAVAVVRGNVLDQVDAQAADGAILCGQRRVRCGGLHERIERRAPVPYPDAEEGRAVHAHPLEAQFHLPPVGAPVAFLRAGAGIGIGGHIDQQFFYCQFHETKDVGVVGGQGRAFHHLQLVDFERVELQRRYGLRLADALRSVFARQSYYHVAASDYAPPGGALYRGACAAEAVAWTLRHIGSYGGDADKIFVAGHSAGGYLALMVALDKSYLAACGVDADRLAGIVPVSGQTVTHFTIRKERGLDNRIPLVDVYAPLNRARKVPFPVLLVTGDRRLEMTARYEENAHLEAVLRSLGNDRVTLYELQGFDHGTVLGPACRLLTEWVKKTAE